MIDWVEIVIGYACNAGCAVCPSAQRAEREPMPLPELTRGLQLGRQRGARGVWFGGGEPTLYPSLPQAVATAKRLGFERIRVQTNAMRLAYPAFTKHLVAAGLSEVAVTFLGADAETHDRLTRTPGAFDLARQGAAQVAALGLPIEIDILASAYCLHQLEDTIDLAAGLGAERICFWLTSLYGIEPARFSDWIPRLSEMAPRLARALDRARDLGLDATTLHTPPCVLPPRHRSCYVHAGMWRLLVVVPGGRAFMAEESPIEGGTFLPACERCSLRAACLGLRDDYLRLHGPSEIIPVGDGE